MQDLTTIINSWPLGWRLVLFAGLAVGAHAAVLAFRSLAVSFSRRVSGHRIRKLRSIGTLVSSAAVFSLYFLTLGFILREFGVSLTAYLASASILGLAVGFGSQGVVQDVVTGLTFIFSDLVDVGDLVEISGQTGVVKSITMRFVELENALGASVFIPNRTISNVVNYPRGYVRCVVDVTLRGDEAAKQAMERTATEMMASVNEQFPGILIRAPGVVGRRTLRSGKEYLRIKFRIWPNRGQPIETSFCKELVALLKQQDDDYADWMVAVFYEVEERTVAPGPPLRWFKQSRTRR